MKKRLSIMLALVMVLTMFAGCGDKSSDNGSAGADKNSGKKYVIATDTSFPPFELTNENNVVEGIDIDILAAIAKDQGFEYELNSLGFDAACAALEANQADGVIAGMSITDDRKKKYDFSDAYYDSTVCAAVKADNAAEFSEDKKALDAIKGATVAVKTGTKSADWAEEIKAEYNLNLKYFDESPLMYQDVITGNSVACFEDYPVMAYGTSHNNGLKLLYEEKEKATPYGFAVSKGKNAELLDMFNKGLANIKADGTYDEIVAKYLGEKEDKDAEPEQKNAE